MNEQQSYQVVVRVNLTELIAEVNTLAKEGWQPLGGIVVTVEHHDRHGYAESNYTYFQAMTRAKAEGQ